MMNIKQNKKNNIFSLKRAGAIAIVSIAGLLGACDAGYDNRATSPEITNDEVVTEPVEPVADLEEVAEETEQFIGETVTIRGEIEEAIAPGVYRLQEENELLAQDSVLIVMPDESPMPIVEDQEVQVTGEVRQFISAEFERDYNLTWDLNVEEQIEAEYEGQPVVVVQNAEILEMD